LKDLLYPSLCKFCSPKNFLLKFRAVRDVLIRQGRTQIDEDAAESILIYEAECLKDTTSALVRATSEHTHVILRYNEFNDIIEKTLG